MRIHLSMLGVVSTPPQCYNPSLLAFSKSPFDNLLGGSGQDKGNPGRSWAGNPLKDLNGHPPKDLNGAPLGAFNGVSSEDEMDTGPVLALGPLNDLAWQLPAPTAPPGLGQADAVPRRKENPGRITVLEITSQDLSPRNPFLLAGSHKRNP